jgi:GNAT superfamily N-acetyltransferase
MSTWTVTSTPVDHPDAADLLRRYFTDIVGRYYGRDATTAEVDDAMADDDPSNDLPLLLIARHGGEPAACAGLRLVEPGLAEIKRVFVRLEFRGRGAGGRLLAAIEEAAAELGVTTLRLDTRHDLVEARGLYAKHGYREVPAFNDDKYAEHWFEKQLFLCSA